jgi:hypothetical protein
MKSMNLIALMLVTVSLLVLPLGWSQGGNAGQQVQTRPDNCPLPDKLEFDYNTPQREKIGIWTGRWESAETGGILCIVITSIQGDEVRGIYSRENKGEGLGGAFKGGFVAFTSKMKVSKSGGTITIKTEEVEAARPRDVTLHFRNDGTALATKHGLGAYSGNYQAHLTKL